MRRALATTSGAGRGGKTILGTTAGSMLFVISGSVLAWPLGDLYFGPSLSSIASRSAGSCCSMAAAASWAKRA